MRNSCILATVNREFPLSSVSLNIVCQQYHFSSMCVRAHVRLHTEQTFSHNMLYNDHIVRGCQQIWISGECKKICICLALNHSPEVIVVSYNIQTLSLFLSYVHPIFFVLCFLLNSFTGHTFNTRNGNTTPFSN